MGGGVISYEVDGRRYLPASSGRPSGFWTGSHPGQATVGVFALPECAEAHGTTGFRILH